MTRREAREKAFELLFETEFRGDEEAKEIYESSVENREIEEVKYIKDAYFTVCDKKDEIDAIISEHSNGWKVGRISKTSISILRLCVYEMVYCDDIPVNVSLNEAIELSKKYDDEKARPFVNGVLNSIKESLDKKSDNK